MYIGVRGDDRSLPVGYECEPSHMFFDSEETAAYWGYEGEYITTGRYEGWYDCGELSGTCVLGYVQDRTVDVEEVLDNNIGREVLTDNADKINKLIKQLESGYRYNHTYLVGSDDYPEAGFDDNEYIFTNAFILAEVR